MSIRNATLSDIPSILELSEAMHRESRFKLFDYDKEKVTQLLTTLINNEYGIVIVVDDDGILGGIMGIVSEHYFGRDKMASDLALFVQQDSRGTKIAIKLIKEYIVQATAKGAVDICISNTTGYEPESVGRFYQMLGFNRVGGNYCLEASHV